MNSALGDMKLKVKRIPRICIQKVSIVGDGMHVEFCMGNEAGKLIEGDPYPIMSVRADSESSKHVIVYTDAGNISIPLNELERAIRYAKEEAHCESYYDEPQD